MRYLILLLSLCISCSVPAETSQTLSDEALILTTDRDVYDAVYLSGEGSYEQYGFTLEVSFTNTKDEPVYLEKCYPDDSTPIYWTLLSDEGGSAYNAPWACVGHDKYVTVAPGETYGATVIINGPNMWDGVTREPLGVLEGTYHLVFERACYKEKVCSSDELRSNPFEVRLKERL